MKVGIKLVKVKKFGIGWCIPHRVVADNAKVGFVRTPSPHLIGLRQSTIKKAVTRKKMLTFLIFVNQCPQAGSCRLFVT